MPCILFHKLKLTERNKSSPEGSLLWATGGRLKIQSILAHQQEMRSLLTQPFNTTVIAECEEENQSSIGKEHDYRIEMCCYPSWHLKTFHGASVKEPGAKAIVTFMSQTRWNHKRPSYSVALLLCASVALYKGERRTGSPSIPMWSSVSLKRLEKSIWIRVQCAVGSARRRPRIPDVGKIIQTISLNSNIQRTVIAHHLGFI